PRTCGSLTGEDFHDGNGHTDAPDGVEGEHEHGPRAPHAQRGDKAAVEQPLARVVSIEQRHRGDTFLEDAVGDPKHHDRWPATAGPADDLADQQRSTAVEWCQYYQSRERGNGQIPEQEFGYQRGQEEEAGGKSDRSHARSLPKTRSNRKIVVTT